MATLVKTDFRGLNAFHLPLPCREIRETVNTIELNFYQEYSITLNAFFVVRWTDKRMIIDKEKMDMVGNLSRDSVYYVNIYDVHNLTIWKQFANFFSHYAI